MFLLSHQKHIYAEEITHSELVQIGVNRKKTVFSAVDHLQIKILKMGNSEGSCCVNMQN